jgi:hypothetical protein
MADLVELFAPPPYNAISASRKFIHEDFKQIPGLNADITVAYNPNFETLGTSGVSADHTFNANGGFNLASHGGATDSAILLPHLDAKQTVFATSGLFLPSNTPMFGWKFKTAAALTNTTIWCGLKLTNTPTIATDNDQILIKYINGTDTNWQSTYSIGGTDVTADTGVAVAAATIYNVWVVIGQGGTGIGTIWINGTKVLTTTALTSSAALIPYLGVLSAVDATAKSVVVYDVWASIPN